MLLSIHRKQIKPVKHSYVVVEGTHVVGGGSVMAIWRPVLFGVDHDAESGHEVALKDQQARVAHLVQVQEANSVVMRVKQADERGRMV